MSPRVILRRARHLVRPQFVSAVFVAFVVEVGLRTTTLPRLVKLLGIRLGGTKGGAVECASLSGAPAALILRRSLEVDRVYRHWPFDGTCLRRALVLGQRIRRLNPLLVIGVRRDDRGELAAHAWLTVAGVSLDPLAEHYTPMPKPSA